MKGYVHIYTGDGKGKTTAAFGLALRAAGAGKRVFIAQFVKGKSYYEIEIIRKYLPDITIKQYGLGCFIIKTPTRQDIDAARNGLAEVAGILASGQYDVVVMDEACIAVYYNLFTVEELIEAIKKKREGTEVIITGRYAHEKLMEMADLVTEMKEVKHYYTKGVESRKGIEY